MRASALRANLGNFWWPKPARERKLKLVCHFLLTKNQNRMLFESRSNGRIDGTVRGNVCKRHASKLGGKSRAQRHNVHGQVLPFFYYMKLGQICGRGNDPAEVPGARDRFATSPLSVAAGSPLTGRQRSSVLSCLDSHRASR